MESAHVPREVSSSLTLRAALLTLLVGLPVGGRCESPQSVPAAAVSPAGADAADTEAHGAAYADIRAYFTAPLHWSSGEWEIFAGVLATVGAAHHFDTQVRSHFVSGLNPTQVSDTKDLQDALPTAAVFVGTLAYANLIDSRSGRLETWTMFEAAALSGVTAYALKYAVDREGPYQTDDPNSFHRAGSSGSFPSVHSTVAFAVGTVLAESGSDDYRWVRRFIGYGLGLATDYERLKHNAHWLSDVVAGSALGAASASFSMNRVYRVDADTGWLLVPVAGGVMLTYRTTLP
jgi:membrane-associated phospholipid phosphatase